MNQNTLSFDTINSAPETVTVQSTTTLKRRVSATGEKHGKAVSQVGVITVAYSTGFAKGFMAGFKD